MLFKELELWRQLEAPTYKTWASKCWASCKYIYAIFWALSIYNISYNIYKESVRGLWRSRVYRWSPWNSKRISSLSTLSDNWQEGETRIRTRRQDNSKDLLLVAAFYQSRKAPTEDHKVHYLLQQHCPIALTVMTKMFESWVTQLQEPPATTDTELLKWG